MQIFYYVFFCIFITWFFIEDLNGVVEVEMPEVPFTSGKPELFASNLHVGLSPVPGVGTHRSPASKLKDLKMKHYDNDFQRL